MDVYVRRMEEREEGERRVRQMCVVGRVHVRRMRELRVTGEEDKCVRW